MYDKVLFFSTLLLFAFTLIFALDWIISGAAMNNADGFDVLDKVAGFGKRTGIYLSLIHIYTISVPRIRPADDIDPETFENAISDDIFKKIVACIRVSVPYTGMIISTRESVETRARIIDFGISQISGCLLYTSRCV